MKLLISALVLFTLSVFSAAWGHQGHALIGAIADSHLNEAARAEVAQLLQADQYADGTPSGRHTLSEIASWADEWRETADGRTTAHWHYEDRPVCSAAPPPCPHQHCIHAALKQQLRILMNPYADKHERNEALKWVVHLVGDLHQPLHVADNRDYGGNRLQVRTTEHRLMSLHHYWDTELVHQLNLSADSAPPPNFTPGSLSEWFTQSYQIAQQHVYGQLPGFQCTIQIEEPVDLSADYEQTSLHQARLQLLRAGYRLALLLNQVLGHGPKVIALDLN